MIRTPLMEHQTRIVEFCLDKDYAGIFADYGTGKTLCALALIQLLKFKRVLIISTKTSVQSTWPDEIRKHTNFRYVLLLGLRRSKVNNIEFAIRQTNRQASAYHSGQQLPLLFLINFEGVHNVFDVLCGINFDAVVIDESTKIKSPRTKRTLAAWALGQGIKRRYIMTGFPVTESLSDIYAQIKFLDSGKTFGNNYYAFLNRHFVKFGPKLVPKRKGAKQILKSISPFCIRVSNESLKLPPEIYKELKVPLTAKQKTLLDGFRATFQLELGKVKIDTQYIFALIAKSLQICDGFIQDNDGNLEVVETNKDEALIETLEEIDISKNKVVIWCAFLFSAAKIKRILKRFGVQCLSLTGKTEDPNTLVRKFQGSKTHNVLIATQKKAAESITLTAARYGLYYSNVWSYDLRGNSEARIRRKGSERHKSIVYIDLLTDSVVEKKVYQCIRTKRNLIKELKKEFVDLGSEVKA